MTQETMKLKIIDSKPVALVLCFITDEYYRDYKIKSFSYFRTV